EEAVKRATEEGIGIARKQAKIKSDLLAKEVEGNRRIAEFKIQALDETISKQREQIVNLSRQLEAASRQAQDLAVKAIEGASNASSFDAIKEIALEQAKNAGKGK